MNCYMNLNMLDIFLLWFIVLNVWMRTEIKVKGSSIACVIVFELLKMKHIFLDLGEEHFFIPCEDIGTV